MKKIFVPNRSSHDFSPADKYGELIFMSDGSVSRYAVNQMYREFFSFLSKSNSDDYILITGLTVMSCVACSIFSAIHRRLNLLLFKNNEYVERNMIMLPELTAPNKL